MAIPPLTIVYYQIKSLNNEFIWKKDYFQFNGLSIKVSISEGLSIIIILNILIHKM